VGNLNAHDFVTSLERLTSAVAAAGMEKVPVSGMIGLVWHILTVFYAQDRYKAFLRMARQYSFLQRVRRAGRGHDPKGLAAMAQGECAVVCWACPYDGRNLPSNWRDVEPKSQ
jgi:hypothetical protein